MGIIRYQWNLGDNIRAGERKGIRLIAQKIQVIISAGGHVPNQVRLCWLPDELKGLTHV
jgi:hypothetical protein